jgi:hypothetical protein
MHKVDALKEAKSKLPEYLNKITIKKGSQYVCPLCKSGTKKTQTPAGSIQVKDDGRLYFHCFSCQFHGDIFDLFGAVNKIPVGKIRFDKVYETLNIIIGNEAKKADISIPINVNNHLPIDPKIADNITFYIEKCKFAAGNTDYFRNRGLSTDTILRYNLGYDFDYTFISKNGKEMKLGEAAIIPYPNEHYYMIRLVNPPEGFNKYKKMTGISDPVYNSSVLYGNNSFVFVVEGQFDALSVIDAGANAVGLGSVDNVNKFIRLCKEKPPKNQLILSLDNDDSGKEAQAKLKERLKDLNISYIEKNISGQYNDPNEHLIQERDTFFEIIYDIIKEKTKIKAETIQKADCS